MRKSVNTLFVSGAALIAASLWFAVCPAAASASVHVPRGHAKLFRGGDRGSYLTVHGSRRPGYERASFDRYRGQGGFPRPFIGPLGIYNYYRHGGPGCTPANAGYDGYYGCGPGYVSTFPLLAGAILTID